ncbi:MAG: DUF2961 domain-containing protein [Candidatus Hinthialibacter antarcticus]|nr:DUF2961 domain-containing protein [Candidatus Hinthialibacter antarcticus]
MRHVLLIAALFAACSSWAFSADETIGFSDLLNQLVDLETVYQPPIFHTGMASSFDRSGGDQDDVGFIRKEGDWFVVAELPGPGAITRIWSANPQGMVRIYVDDGGQPLIQRNFRDLFLDKIEPFKKPFVRGAPRIWGAHWSYAPVPFEQFCKITLSAQCFYQIDYITYPIDQKVKSLTLPLSKSEKSTLTSVGKQFVTAKAAPYKISKTIKREKFSASLPAGDRIQLATFEGPAVFRGMRARWSGEKDETGRELMLYCAWDDEDSPSVQSPLYDFFGGRVKSLAIGRDEDGWRYCYLPMPFARNARVWIENGAESATRRIDVEIDWQPDAELPDNLRTFHALWKRDNDTQLEPIKTNLETATVEADPRRNYAALSTMGAGHFVGVTLHRLPAPESDAMLFVDDDEWPPDGPGTGNAGFFNQAGDAQTVSWPLSAAALKLHGMNGFLRLMFPYPVDFRERLVLSFEQGHANAMRQDYSSTVYWYQEEPHPPFPYPVPAAARQFRTEVLTQPEWILQEDQAVPVVPYEGEDVMALAVGGLYEPQDMRPFGPDWSGNKQLRFEAEAPGAYIEFQGERLAYSGYYNVECGVTQAPDAAIAEISLNNRVLFPYVDLYGNETKPARMKTTQPEFFHASEPPILRYEVSGQNNASKGYVIGVDSFYWEETRTVPTSITIQGPYWSTPESDQDVFQEREAQGGDSIALGYEPSGGVSIIPLKANDEGYFQLPESERQDGAYVVLWNVDAPESGIYRFEAAPFEATPYLFKKDSDMIETMTGWVVINGIPLQGETELRMDPRAQQRAAVRFSLPLRKGANELMWMVNQKLERGFQPVMYGISRY